MYTGIGEHYTTLFISQWQSSAFDEGRTNFDNFVGIIIRCSYRLQYEVYRPWWSAW